MDFYDRVKQLAKQVKNQTVQEFVMSLDMSRESYYTMKKSGNLPRADDAVKIARALAVSVEYLVTGDKQGSAGPAERIQDLALQILKEASRLQ
ncbi:MAG: helix-turn-helix domain-containing protein [Treponema sp.]|nr:helix-turn-helix domain-containing protein [Treponema sp.]